MSRSSGAIIDAFGEYLTGARSDLPNRWQRDNVLTEAGEDGRAVLYSYGRHFPMCEYFPAGRHGRRRPLLLLNGDTFSVTTSRHQNQARGMADRVARAIGADVLVIPYATLGAAGIARETVRPLEVRPDRTVTLDTVPVPFALDDVGTAHSSAPFEGWRERGTRYTWRDENGRRYIRDIVTESSELIAGAGYYLPNGERLEGFTLTTEQRDAGAEWQSERREWRQLSEPIVRPATVATTAAGDGWTELEQDGAGGYQLVRRRHMLGDSLFTARARGRRRKFLSSWDENERNLYFLAELPRTPASTVAAAIDALAPPAVHAALAQGRDVKRQGDIFFIPVDLEDAAVYGRAVARARLTQWTIGARPRAGELGYVDARTRADRIRAEYLRLRRPTRVASHVPRRPGALTAEEWRAIHNVPTWDEQYARESIIRKHGASVSEYRRDDWRQTERRYRARRGKLEQLPASDALWRARSTVDAQDRDALAAILAVYGTSHTATEVARASRGAVYVRGIVRHVPALVGEGRARDHVNVKLGDTWHLAVRNTVPRQ